MKGHRLSVVMAHSGIQYSYGRAYALQEEDLLAEFWTTLYDFGYFSRIPFLKGYATRRRHRELRPELVHAFIWPELFHRSLMMLLGENHFTRNKVLGIRNRWFDWHVSKRLKNILHSGFIGFSGGCLRSIKEAKRLGRWALVDQHDIHPRAAEHLLREEIEMDPDFSALTTYWPPDRHHLNQALEELEVADKILVVSTFALKTFQFYGVKDEKLVTLPMAFDPPNEVIRSPEKPDKFRILFVGTISQRKGIRYLLEAVKQLNLSGCELVLLGPIGGDARPLAAYRDFFIHHGFVPSCELEKYWKTSHLLVLPSLYDGFGQVILEAMGHGVPVIVSENTAARDAVRDGTDGFVVPIRDVKALKDRILRLYQNLDLWNEMSRNARIQAQQFTWKKYRERLTKFLYMTFNRDDLKTHERNLPMSKDLS